MLKITQDTINLSGTIVSHHVVSQQNPIGHRGGIYRAPENLGESRELGSLGESQELGRNLGESQELGRSLRESQELGRNLGESQELEEEVKCRRSH